jgi:hypothetical protein
VTVAGPVLTILILHTMCTAMHRACHNNSSVNTQNRERRGSAVLLNAACHKNGQSYACQIREKNIVWCSDLIRAGRSGDRIPVGAKFSAAVQTGPGAYLALCTMSTGSFSGVKWPGRGVDHPPPSSAEVKERVDLYLYSPSGPSWPVLG